MSDTDTAPRADNAFCLIVALPPPGHTGAPRGLFYPDTDIGRATAEAFAEENRRPGYGVFESSHTFADGDVNMSTFNAVLREMGWQDE